MILKEPDVNNIARASGVIQSGKVFSPEVIQGKECEITIEPTKGKDVTPPEAEEVSSKKEVIAEEDREFLKVIKKSDYKFIDQLNQTPSKISILSLLMSYEAHRTSLLKFLNEAYIAKDIVLISFANLRVGSCLMFTDDDLPSNGRDHNMEFYISIQCINVTLD